MNHDLSEYKKVLETKIKKLGYNELRVSIFNNKNESREEWQTRIEYNKETKKYQVYSLADRASLMGGIKTYSHYKEAEEDFLNKLKLTVTYNAMMVNDGETPEYSCVLWSK